MGERCLVPGSADEGGGRRVVVAECGGPEDRWQLLPAGGSQPYDLLHVGTGRCLAGDSASAGGTPSILVECDGGAAQRWRLAPTVCTRDTRGLCLNRRRFRVDVHL